MATSRSSSPPSPSTPGESASGQGTNGASSGLTNGSGPDVSGGLAAPKPASKSRVKTKPPEGTSAQGKPAEGSSAAKPASKARGKGAAGQVKGAAAVKEVESRPDAGAGTGDAAGPSAGEPPPSTTAPSGERVSDEDRQRRIAERAYHKAQERGFQGHRDLDDWLEAEREYDQGS